MGLVYVAIALCFGIAGGIVGRIKGSSFFLWFLISAIVPVVGPASPRCCTARTATSCAASAPAAGGS